MKGITLITFTRNSSKRLQGLLEGVKDLVDEIIIVDGYSTDDTVEIALSYGSKVYRRKPWGYVEPDRMFAVRKASYDWILCLDDDERLGTRLKQDLRGLVEGCEPAVSAFSITRFNILPNGTPLLGIFYPDKQIRVYRKDKVLYKGLVHEHPTIYGGIKYLPDEYHIIHMIYEGFFSMEKTVRYAYFTALEYHTLKAKNKLRIALYKSAPLSTLPFFFYLLMWGMMRRKPMNLKSVLYTFKNSVYESLASTLINFRGEKRSKIAKVVEEKGLIQLLGLDS
ncbi:MAG: glycosyltransferase family 2 protein [Candidatus Korarchaeum sp.]|nr:glycosyltransferase family 2 protein [Candidatus Korarchaeum sp.]